ncbi:hypothetical protein SLA2020_003850 [Shorea laevis]
MTPIPSLKMQELSIDTNKLIYEIFSILVSKVLFGYDDQTLQISKRISSTLQPKLEAVPQPTTDSNNISAIKGCSIW